MLPLVIWIGFERIRDSANLTWVLISIAPPLITVMFALAPIIIGLIIIIQFWQQVLSRLA